MFLTCTVQWSMLHCSGHLCSYAISMYDGINDGGLPSYILTLQLHLHKTNIKGQVRKILCKHVVEPHIGIPLF